MKRKRDLEALVKTLEGLQTVESIMEILKVKRKTAITYISKLRKKGYVEYFSKGGKKRIYKISVIKTKFKGEKGLYELINKHSKIKVNEPYKQIIHGKKLSIEEALVLALKSQNFRLILASLNLFKYIKSWKKLNEFAKEHKVQRQVGALYDISRLFIKTKKIDKRIEKSLLEGKGNRYIYDALKTKDFFNIAKKWKVEIPFQELDLIRLKTG